MPFSLNPSGFFPWFHEHAAKNLLAGQPCPRCKRVAGHVLNCPYYKEPSYASSRPSLFNASAVLWAKSDYTNFITFTLPSIEGKVYQKATDCPSTGDVAVTSKFSKTLEAWSVRRKRAGRGKLSYAWVAEAQMDRKQKFGGVGDIHFHLATNAIIKRGRKVVDLPELKWLQSLWCSHIGVSSDNCVDVRGIPHDVKSIPAYMAKYMGKGFREYDGDVQVGGPRRILSRKFFATRDLSRFKPIHLERLPEDIEVINTVYHQVKDFEFTYHYLDTRTVLELYGAEMIQQGLLSGRSTGPGFSPGEIQERENWRVYMRSLSELQREEQQEPKEVVTYDSASAFTRKLAEKVDALSGKKSPQRIVTGVSKGSS